MIDIALHTKKLYSSSFEEVKDRTAFFGNTAEPSPGKDVF
jgi:hypothetical protein